MQFRMKDLGELKYFLGIEIIRAENGIYMLQKQYGRTVLKKCGMLGCKPINIPLDRNCKLRAYWGTKIADVNMYRSMVGSLVYLTITRSDLSYAVGLVSQFMQQPTKPHLDYIRKILRYSYCKLWIVLQSCYGYRARRIYRCRLGWKPN